MRNLFIFQPTEILSIAVFFSLIFNAQSFYLSTHRELTELAIEEFFSCVNSEILNEENIRPYERFKDVLIEENLQEDNQYLSKMLQYSHFYNPNFSVNAEWGGIDRCSSDYRVKQIEQILRKYYLNKNMESITIFWDTTCRPNPIHVFLYGEMMSATQTSSLTINFSLKDRLFAVDQEYLGLLGHVIHHLQDMASPAHVVPIMHPSVSFFSIFSHDAFESYSSRDELQVKMKYEKESAQGLCDFKMTAPDSLFHLLNTSARRVLTSLKEDISVMVDNVPKNVTWEKWYNTMLPPNKNGMRSYGPYRNTFGLTEFYNSESEIIKVDRKLYEIFVLTRYRQAVEDTKMALYYFWLLLETIGP